MGPNAAGRSASIGTPAVLHRPRWLLHSTGTALVVWGAVLAARASGIGG
jgi:hypothetical protein